MDVNRIPNPGARRHFGSSKKPRPLKHSEESISHPPPSTAKVFQIRARRRTGSRGGFELSPRGFPEASSDSSSLPRGFPVAARAPRLACSSGRVGGARIDDHLAPEMESFGATIALTIPKCSCSYSTSRTVAEIMSTFRGPGIFQLTYGCSSVTEHGGPHSTFIIPQTRHRL